MAGSKEDVETVRAFFQDLRIRGLGDPLLVVSDGASGDHPGDRGMPSPDRRASVASHTGCAISRPRSRRIHGRNSRPGSQPAIRRPRGRLRANWRPASAPITPTSCRGALACFEDDFESCIAHLRLPVTHRRFVRTTNLLERLFVEERRRLKIIPNGFGEKPVLKLMFGALIRGRRTLARSALHRIRAAPDRRSQEGP